MGGLQADEVRSLRWKKVECSFFAASGDGLLLKVVWHHAISFRICSTPRFHRSSYQARCCPLSVYTGESFVLPRKSRRVSCRVTIYCPSAPLMSRRFALWSALDLDDSFELGGERERLNPLWVSSRGYVITWLASFRESICFVLRAHKKKIHHGRSILFHHSSSLPCIRSAQ